MTEADAYLEELHETLGVALIDETPKEPAPEVEEQIVLADQPKIIATEAAMILARAANIDLADVHGTGQDGRIKKSDVQNLIDVRLKMSEAEKEVEEIGTHAIPYQPDTFGRYESLYHYSRTIHPLGGLGEGIKSPEDIKNKIESDFFAKGWELAFVEPLGYGPDGLSVLWIFGKVREGLESKHKEIWHIQRTLGSNVMEGQVTGFGVDAYLKSYLDEGWSLFSAKALMRGGSEVPMMWVLVR